MKRAAWLSAVILLAGCVGDETPKATTGPTTDAAAGTGIIEVTVTTPELEPVAQAEVAIYQTAFSAFTDPQGLARFTGLEFGEYTLIAAKPGYRAVQERGRAVTVASNDVVAVKLTLDSLTVLNASTSYHKIIPFQGFIACSFYGAVIGYNSYCGRGVTLTNGQTYGGDPNDKTIHPWDVENRLIETMLYEVKWTPNQDTLGKELWARIMSFWDCAGTTSSACQPGDQIAGQMGKSPLKVRRDEGATQNITRKIAAHNPSGKYPYRVYDEVRAWCNSATSGGDCYMTLMINQRYDSWQTAFYGAPAPEGFTSLPPS